MIRIVVNLRLEGFHYWADAPSEVRFLASPHRHEFHVRMERDVVHEDREIEIILFKRKAVDVIRRVYGDPCAFGSRSCEAIASEFIRMFGLSSCTVLEDGENGATVTPGATP